MSATQLSLFDAPELSAPKKSPDLNSILECLDSIPNINRGGCGISALSIYRWCKANDIPVSDRPFVILNEDIEELIANENALANNDIDQVGIPHVVIEIGGALWDSTGSDRKHNQNGLWKELPYRTEHKLSADELLYIINSPGWNGWFSRERSIPIIEYGLDVDLSDVEIW
jgi:hypothetical protein